MKINDLKHYLNTVAKKKSLFAKSCIILKK